MTAIENKWLVLVLLDIWHYIKDLSGFVFTHPCFGRDSNFGDVVHCCIMCSTAWCVSHFEFLNEEFPCALFWEEHGTEPRQAFFHFFFVGIKQLSVFHFNVNLNKRPAFDLLQLAAYLRFHHLVMYGMHGWLFLRKQYAFLFSLFHTECCFPTIIWF